MSDMYQNGFTAIECIDWSDVIIRKMAAKYKDNKGMNFQTMEVSSMPDFNDNSFDAVIDKVIGSY